MSSRKPLDRDLYDAVVAEAKSRFDVWPSAYASGWVVKTYKARGGRYAGGDRKTRSGLTKWFGESWVDLSKPLYEVKRVSGVLKPVLVGYEPCGRKTARGASKHPAAYPKCRPLKEAMRMTPDEVEDAIKRKRAAEAKAARGGRGGRGARAPVRVSTYRKNPANAVFDWELPGTHGIREVTVDDVTIVYGYNGESAHIASVRTKTKEQGKGKARRVMERFCEEADALGIPIKLEASPLTKKVNRARLVAFYESLGFEKTGRTINPVGDPEMVRLPARANPDVTSTQAFRRWFGDSKVVDENGEPLVVWHGHQSEAGSFHVFDFDRAIDLGMHFGTKQAAKDAVKGRKSRENVRPFYLSLQNPLLLTDPSDWIGVFQVPVLEELLREGVITKKQHKEAYAKVKALASKSAVEKALRSRDRAFVKERSVAVSQIVRDVIVDAGYDGVVYANETEDVGSRSWVAFYPEQIKLADGTNTTFDPANPDVRLNPDDAPVVVLYHRTTPANAAKIVRERRWMSREQPPFVFFSTDPYGHGTSYGEALLEVVVPEDVARLDDEFPSGEQHYAVLTRDLAGLPVRLVEARANPQGFAAIKAIMQAPEGSLLVSEDGGVAWRKIGPGQHGRGDWARLKPSTTSPDGWQRTVDAYGQPTPPDDFEQIKRFVMREGVLVIPPT